MMLLALVLICIAVGHSQVLVFPPDTVVAAVGGSVNFNCFSSFNGVESIAWLANETVIETSSNVTQSVVFQTGFLWLYNLTLYYNMTKFACLVYYNDRQTLRSNGATLLLVQGSLSSVESWGLTLYDGSIYLNWTAPFSLNLTDHEPDITYCVCVLKSDYLVAEECNIVETEFYFPIPSDSVCFRYTFRVVPESIAGDGPAITIPYLPIPSGDVSDILHSGDVSYSLIMSSPACEGRLTFEDLDDGEIITLEDYELTIAGNNITFTNVLRFNRRYNVTIKTSTFDAMATSFITISTHGVTDAVVMERNGIEVITLYSEHSSASGALFSFVFITESGDVDFTRSALLPLDKNASHNYTLPFNLYPGHYMIYVYDIEQDGTLYNGVGYPAVTEELSINGTENGTENGHGQPCTSTENCHISTSRGIIRATCSMPGGFQVIALQSNANRVHLIYTNKSMDLQTPATVQVERSGVYQVTMFAIREDSTFACSEQATVDVHIETAELQPTVTTALQPTVTTEFQPTVTTEFQSTVTTELQPTTDIPEPEDDSAVLKGAVVGVFLVVAVAVGVVVAVLVIFICRSLIAKRKGSGAQSHGSCSGGVALEEGKADTSAREEDPLLGAVPNSQHQTNDGEEEQNNESPAHLAASTNNLPPKECSANLTDSTAELSPEEQVRPENKAAPAYSPLELPTRPAEDPAASNEGDHPISEKPSVQESTNDDNSEEEPFVVAGVERGGTKPNWRIVGLEANAKKKQSVDQGGGGTFDQESNQNSNHGMPLIARARDYDGQTHEAKSDSALPAFHKEVSHVMGGDIVLDKDPQQDETPPGPGVGQKNAQEASNTLTLQTQAEEAQQRFELKPGSVTTDHTPNTPTLQNQALEVSPASGHTPNTPTLQTQVSPASDYTPDTPTLQTQALEVSPASDHTPDTPTPQTQALAASDHTPNTPTLQTQALEVSPAFDHTPDTQTQALEVSPASDHTPGTPTPQTQALEVSPASGHTPNTPTLQTQALEVSPASDHTPNTPTLQTQALETQDLDVSPVEADQLAGVEGKSIEPDTTPTLQSEVGEESQEEERESG